VFQEPKSLLLRILVLAYLPGLIFLSDVAGQNKTISRTHLRGRVLAAIDSPNFGAGVSLLHQQFIFGLESKDHRGEDVITPVEISYSFTPSEGPLPESFFDHSKLYELQGYRAPNGDSVLASIAYIKNSDGDGNPLPSKLILRLLDGAPKDILKMNMVLPVYLIGSDNYRIIDK